MRSATDEGMAIVPRLPISGRRDRTNTSLEDRDSRLWHFSDMAFVLDDVRSRAKRKLSALSEYFAF
jgi:hypothetical protein